MEQIENLISRANREPVPMPSNSCFVMMPFSPRLQSYYKKIFSPTVRSAGLRPVKVDEIHTPGQISNDIFDLIQNADIILADVTGKNPNVNYELGIAHALGKKTVIITQSADDVPFDYRHLRYISYDTQNASWEKRLRDDIRLSIRSALALNTQTSFIAGVELKNLFAFLEDTALDASYEVSKEATIESDLTGSCRVEQKWTIRAKTNVTHIIHGVVGDEPGSIRLTRAYDKTNGVPLRTLISIGEEKRVRYIIFLTKMLQSGETLQFDFDYQAGGFVSHLFMKRSITIFQRSNSRRGVFYRNRKDVYRFPANDFTKKLFVKFNGSAPDESSKVEELDGMILISIEMNWPEPYSGIYSYEINSNK